MDALTAARRTSDLATSRHEGVTVLHLPANEPRLQSDWADPARRREIRHALNEVYDPQPNQPRVPRRARINNGPLIGILLTFGLPMAVILGVWVWRTFA